MKSTIHEHQKNNFYQVSKTLKNIGLLFLATITLVSCTPNDEELTSATPQNIAPVNGKSFTADEASRLITFRWTPLVPKPAEPVHYRLRVWQLMQGQNGTQAMRMNEPKIVRDVVGNTTVTVSGLYTGPCKPPYLCDFIWSVEVIGQGSNGTPGSTPVVMSNPTVFNF